MGTVNYMSPEQVRAKELDARTDLFSFGAALYEMSTRTLPFRGESIGEIFEAILNRAPVSPTRLNPDLPAELERIILKCLEKDRDLRYQHASDLRTDLQRLKRDTGSAQLPLSTKSRDATAIARRWKMALSALAVSLALLVGGYLYFHQSTKLTDKDTIVLADFTNSTGDAVFDGTLRQGMAVQLEQSPFLSLVPDDRIQRTLHLMGQPADARLTPEVAREVCERTASAAVLDGSIASLGSQYVLGLRAKDCRTGAVLAEEQMQAARKEDVLNALSQVASKFRTRVGESLSTVEKHDKPLDEATTSSLDALKAYSAGWRAHFSGGPVAATPSFKQAIEIDPKFASAYAALGLMYGANGESTLSGRTPPKPMNCGNARLTGRGSLSALPTRLERQATWKRRNRPVRRGRRPTLATWYRSGSCQASSTQPPANMKKQSKTPKDQSRLIRILPTGISSLPATILTLAVSEKPQIPFAAPPSANWKRLTTLSFVTISRF
jgi:hypothetical protein